MNTTHSPTKSDPPRKSRRVLFEKPISVEVRGFSEAVHLFAHDLSAGGIFLCTQSPLPVGTKVTLQFGGPELPVQVDEAKVVWTTESEGIQDNTTLGMGLRFHDVSARDRMNLLLTVDRFMRKKAGPFEDPMKDITLPYSVPPEMFFENLDARLQPAGPAGPDIWGDLGDFDDPHAVAQPTSTPGATPEVALPQSIAPQDAGEAPETGLAEESAMVFEVLEEESVLEPQEAKADLDLEDPRSWLGSEDAFKEPWSQADPEPDLPIEAEGFEEAGGYQIGSCDLPPAPRDGGPSMTMPAAIDAPAKPSAGPSPMDAILALEITPPELPIRRSYRPHLWIGGAVLALVCLTWAVISFVQHLETSADESLTALTSPDVGQPAEPKPEQPLPSPPARVILAGPAATPTRLSAQPEPARKAATERPAGAAELTSPTFVESADGWQIVLPSGQPLKAKVFKMNNPPRVVLDFAGAKYQGKSYVWKTPVPSVPRLRIAQQAGFTRVVVDMDGSQILPFEARTSPEGFVLLINR